MVEDNEPVLEFEPYSFIVPKETPVLRGWLNHASALLEVCDVSVDAWRERATTEDRNNSNGIILGLLERARHALRSVQILAMHGQAKDSVAVGRVIAETFIYAGYIWAEPVCADERAACFAEFEVVHRLRAIENLRALGLGGRLDVAHVQEVNREYEQVQAKFPGTNLWRKVPFADSKGKSASLRTLAIEAGLEQLYRMEFDHGSNFVHVTPAALQRDGYEGRTLGIIAATRSFRLFLSFANEILALRIGPRLKELEAESAALAPE